MVDEVEVTGRQVPSTPPPEPARTKFDAFAEPIIILLVGLAAAGIGLWAVWSIGVSTVDWLKTGYWAHPSLIEALQGWGWTAPTFDWVIFQRVLTWVLNLPSGLVFVGLSIWRFAGAQGMDAEATAREARMKARG